MSSGIAATEPYGPSEYQVGDLHLPDGPPRGVVCLLHGGFWRMPYAREEMAPVARALAGDGLAVWNLEYRRLGGGGGWPETFLDVARGIDHLAELAARYPLALDRIVVAGHSAGGHLALWSARAAMFPGVAAPRIRIAAAVGLAPVADLAAAHALSLGRGAVAEFLGDPARLEERLALASPRALLPLGAPQLVIHGDLDEALPVGLSEAYVEAARAAGDEAGLIRLADAGHMDFLDPESRAILEFRAWLKDRFPQS